MSLDVSQIRMDQITECYRGITAKHDDIIVLGKEEQEYDENLKQLMVTATQNGTVFNSKRYDIKKDCVSFFGCIFALDGMVASPQKV